MKKISFQTNHNNKLASNCFLHIDHAPAGGVAETLMEKTEIEISTDDKTHPPVRVKLVDLCRQPLYQLSNISTFQSHGLDANAFQERFLSLHPYATIITPIAIYYYKKLN